MSLKSGTNRLRGNLFEFLRNSPMDATPYFQPAGTPNPLFIQNQFDATIGGPLRKDRTFFFGSWQSSREGNAAPQTGNVRTLPMRDGVFPRPVRDPLTRANFPNSTCRKPLGPAGSQAAGVVSGAGCRGRRRGAELFLERERAGIRRRIQRAPRLPLRAARFHLGRVSQNVGRNQVRTTLPEPANQQGYTDLGGRQWMFSETQTVATNKVNEFRFGLVDTHIRQDIFALRLFDEFGIKGALNEPKINRST